MSKSKSSGYEYEKNCAKYLKKKGYKDIRITPKTGDQGIDIVCSKDGKVYGFQCKLYTGPVGNKAVQEAYSGAAFYHCDVAAVMTNSSFTKSAIELGHKIGVKLYTNSISADYVKKKMEHQKEEKSEPFNRNERIDYMVQYLNNNRIMTIKTDRNEAFPIDFIVHYQGR